MLINQMHFLLSFITTFKSTIGACPTKIGEALACGVPIISNSGIGDIETILHEVDAGIILSSYSKVGVGEAIKFIASEAHVDRQSIRENSRKYFDLDIANGSYRRVYEMLQDLV
jgi:glycosyltransferase involved in cell wall biosynthesis